MSNYNIGGIKMYSGFFQHKVCSLPRSIKCVKIKGKGGCGQLVQSGSKPPTTQS